MKIIEIGCSTIGDHNGIGKHARIVTEEFSKRSEIESAKLVSGNTIGFSKLQYIFSAEMMNAFSKAGRIVKEEKTTCVIVEYPFSEYNPLILFSFLLLKRVCHQNNCKLALSMHEYDRVNPLRKMMVKFFVKHADFVYVSEEKYLSKLKSVNPKLYLRTIPNHVEIEDKEKSETSKNEFVYFGLINKAKAFDEMIAAWDKFNANNEYHLNIVTATQIDFDASLHNNVTLYIGLDDEKSAEIMWNSQFSIVPVKPSIGLNNSTFVSTTQCGCIPIGLFNEDLKNKLFVINANSYCLDDFCESLISATKIDNSKLRLMSKDAVEFGKSFSIKATVNMMLEAIVKEAMYENRN